MKSIIFIVLGILLASESKNFLKCSCDLRNSESTCLLCDETPCKCEQLALEDDGSRISIKKLIFLFLKKVDSKCPNPDTCQKCRHCQYTCPKNSIIVRLLRDILNKVDCDKKEDSLLEAIRKLLDPLDCAEKPCHCDPQVQQFLKTILKKGANSECKGKNLSKQKLYKYWFRASKDTTQKKTVSKCEQQQENQNLNPYEGAENTPSLNVEAPNKYNKNTNGHKCASKCCKGCKFYKKSDCFICPRSLTDVCPISKPNVFSICAECSACRLFPKKTKDFVTLFCDECRALNRPFVQFTSNGYPFRHHLERRIRIQIKTRFLQVNDFRSKKEDSAEAVYNPFYPECNIPKKGKGRQKRDEELAKTLP